MMAYEFYAVVVLFLLFFAFFAFFFPYSFSVETDWLHLGWDGLLSDVCHARISREREGRVSLAIGRMKKKEQVATG
ncbi:hypothetical protein F5X99DRAFT_381064 [Biscogniauxia marginata]|nr:hypothetical protein F5X99DRAFT_381064 [Biscogniauxia marginata]